MTDQYTPPHQVNIEDVPNHISDSNQGESCCICHIDTSLLKRMYPEFGMHPEGKYPVRIANDQERNENLIVNNPNRDYRDGTDRPLVMIQPDTKSLFLEDGDLLLVNPSFSHTNLAQARWDPADECFDVHLLA